MVSRLVSRSISLDPRVTGALLPGYALHVEPIAGLVTAAHIPSITYIYADDQLMNIVSGCCVFQPFRGYQSVNILMMTL